MGSSLDAFLGRVYVNGARQDLAGGLDFATGLQVMLVVLEDGPILRVTANPASGIANDSGVTGATVADALNTLLGSKAIVTKTSNSGTAPPDSVTLGTAGNHKFLRVSISAHLGLDLTAAGGKLYGYLTNTLLLDAPTTTIAGVNAQPVMVFDMSLGTDLVMNAVAIVPYTDAALDCQLAWKFNAAGIAAADDYSFTAYYTIEDHGAVPT